MNRKYPVAVRPRGRGDEAPVLPHAQAEQPPVEPRHVVGDQEHRPRRVQHAAAVNAKAKQDTGQQSADEADKKTSARDRKNSAGCSGITAKQKPKPQPKPLTPAPKASARDPAAGSRSRSSRASTGQARCPADAKQTPARHQAPWPGAAPSPATPPLCLP